MFIVLDELEAHIAVKGTLKTGSYGVCLHLCCQVRRRRVYSARHVPRNLNAPRFWILL